jgi:hypothetical protein
MVINHLVFMVMLHWIPRRFKKCFTMGELMIIAVGASFLMYDWMERLIWKPSHGWKHVLIFFGETLLTGTMALVIACFLLRHYVKEPMVRLVTSGTILAGACAIVMRQKCGTDVFIR